jgi:hypothetical protein
MTFFFARQFSSESHLLKIVGFSHTWEVLRCPDPIVRYICAFSPAVFGEDLPLIYH